jgi:hypothetical protein
MFKYMSAEVAPLFAKTMKVRFTQPSDLNDPFEFRPLMTSRPLPWNFVVKLTLESRHYLALLIALWT